MAGEARVPEAQTLPEYLIACAVRAQGGKEPNSNDCKLGPQLKHVIIGSKTIKVRHAVFKCAAHPCR